MSGDELNIFCRLPVRCGREIVNVVAGMLPGRPGEIVIQTNDDNDYFDARFPVRSVGAAAGIQFREDGGRYPWEDVMVEARDEVREVLNG